MQTESEILMLHPESPLCTKEPDSFPGSESLPMEDIKISPETEKSTNLSKFAFSADISLVTKTQSDITLSNLDFPVEACKESM